MRYLPNIKHKKTITPENYIFRVNLYAAWIHLLNAMIQTISGQWLRFSMAAKDIPGGWHIQGDAQKVVKAVKAASVFLEKYSDRLDSVDLAEWRNVKDTLKVHDEEQEEINQLIAIFGKYYLTCYGRPENREKLKALMETMEDGTTSDEAADVFALNFIYTLNF